MKPKWQKLASLAHDICTIWFQFFGAVFASKGYPFKAAYPVTMNIFRKKYFLFKSFVKVELSYVFTIEMFSTAEICMEK